MVGEAETNTLLDSAEIIDLKNNTTYLLNAKYPNSLRGCTGVFIDDMVIICGGYGYGNYFDGKNYLSKSDCYKLSKGMTNFSEFKSMIYARAYASSTVTEDGHILVTGGANGISLRTAESIDPRSPSAPTELDMLKEHTYHVIISLNVTTYFFIGGCTDYSDDSTTSGKTYYYKNYDKSWTEGPALLKERKMHSAGVIYDTVTKNEHVVVVGGRGKNDIKLNSVEILYNKEGQWKQGK